MTNDDMALLREYARSNSEQAFAALVSRHINLVYTVALRQVRDSHLAQEIAQTVFVILARKAEKLGPNVILSGWLCRTTRYVSADTLKLQRRRQMREQESKMQSMLNESDSDAWAQIEPMLDDALNALTAKEHDAIVLRFFDRKEFKQVGAVMGIGEDAARMRVIRAIENLRRFFSQRGVKVSSSGAIVVALTANSLRAAPAGLAAAVTASALSGATHTTAAVVAATKLITMTTLQKTLITATAVALTGAVIHQTRQVSQLKSRLAATLTAHEQQSELLRQQRDELSAQLAEMRGQSALNQSNMNEVVRLRGELARLRAADHKPAQKDSLAQSPEADKTIKAEIPKSSWADAGFATPEAALRTRGWSVLNGDRQRFKESLFITDGARKAMEDMLVRMAQQSNDPNKNEMIQTILDQKLGVEDGILMPLMAENQQKGYAGYRIDSDQQVGPDERLLQIETLLADGSTKQEILTLRQFGGDWKVVIDEPSLKNVH